jgi:hypothetical protein
MLMFSGDDQVAFVVLDFGDLGKFHAGCVKNDVVSDFQFGGVNGDDRDHVLRRLSCPRVGCAAPVEIKARFRAFLSATPWHRAQK